MQTRSILRGLALTALTFATLASQASTELYPTVDYNVAALHGINGGSSLTVNWQSESANVGLLQFDLTGVTDVATATLNLYQRSNQFVDKETGVFSLFVNTSPWVGVTHDWSSLPTHEAAPTSSITLTAAETPGAYRSFDVTAAVQNWASGAMPNYGFTLARTDASNPFIYFAATEEGAYARPKLSITTVPEAGTFALSLIGLALVGGAVARHKRG